MATAACLPITADRVGACVRTLFFEGLDLTGVTLAMELRLNPETPGAAPIALGMGATANAEGLRLVAVTTAGGIPTSQVALRINEATMKDAAKVPYSGELGSSSALFYDLIGTFGQDKRRLVYGQLIALPTVYGMDNAPANRSQGGAVADTPSTWSAARLTFTDERVMISIDGVDLLLPQVAKAADAADRAEAAKTAILQNIDLYQVTFSGPVIVDVAAGLVRYPQMLLMREGAQFADLNPSVYGMGTFDLPFVVDGQYNNVFHYIDVAGLGSTATSPVKSISGAQVKAETLAAIPLGNSFLGVYTGFWGADVVRSDRLRGAQSLALSRGEVYVDAANVWGGGAGAVYFPTGADAPILDPIGGRMYPVANAESSERAGYCKLIQPDQNSLYAIVLDRSDNLLKVMDGATLRNGMRQLVRKDGSNGYVPLAFRKAGGDWVSEIPMRSTQQAAPTPTAALAARDAANLQRSQSMKTRIVSSVQTPSAPFNLLILDGQSLAAGQETWPRLSKAAYGGNKMLGTAPFPASYASAVYNSFGDDQLHDLVSVVVNGGHNTILTDEQAAALQPTDGSFGEPPNVGWANGAKWLLNQRLLTANDARTYVTIDCGISGQPISSFTTGGAWRGRIRDGVTRVKAATGAGNVVVSGLMWMQGEWDYLQQSGDNISGGPAGVNRKATYKASFKTLLDDYQTDLRAITGQALPIPLFTYQTGARFTRDTDADGNPAMAIGMAQLETALERSDLWMVGPTYPVTDKGLHLDSNGSRWFGHQIAKVYHRVVHLGQDWEPLRPIRIEQIGTSIYLDFHVPEPPLVWDTPYDSNTARTVANRGFRVSDGDAGATAVPISAVELIGQTQVRIDLGRATTGTVNVWYASQATDGYGMLRDSDQTVAKDLYEYQAGTGQYDSANIPALVGKPYPLANWCVGFFYPVGLGLGGGA